MAYETRPPSLRLGFNGISNPGTQTAIYTISRSASRFPSFLFKDLLLTLTHTGTSKQLATIRFHRTLSTIELEVNDRKTALAPAEGWRWSFQPTFPSSKVEQWLWKSESDSNTNAHSAVLIDRNDNNKRFARVDKDVLSFESLFEGMSDEMRDDVVVSAMAIYEKLRKQAGNTRAVDLGNAMHARESRYAQTSSAGSGIGYARGSAAAAAAAAAGGAGASGGGGSGGGGGGGC